MNHYEKECFENSTRKLASNVLRQVTLEGITQ